MRAAPLVVHGISRRAPPTMPATMHLAHAGAATLPRYFTAPMHHPGSCWSMQAADGTYGASLSPPPLTHSHAARAPHAVRSAYVHTHEPSCSMSEGTGCVTGATRARPAKLVPCVSCFSWAGAARSWLHAGLRCHYAATTLPHGVDLPALQTCGSCCLGCPHTTPRALVTHSSQTERTHMQRAQR